jgi:hypothetical protein
MLDSTLYTSPRAPVAYRRFSSTTAGGAPFIFARSIARSARSTPTRILLAFQSWTRLITFLSAHTGAHAHASAAAHESVPSGAHAPASPGASGAGTHFVR